MKIIREDLKSCKRTAPNAKIDTFHKMKRITGIKKPWFTKFNFFSVIMVHNLTIYFFRNMPPAISSPSLMNLGKR
jgi:hypothetical protein